LSTVQPITALASQSDLYEGVDLPLRRAGSLSGIANVPVQPYLKAVGLKTDLLNGGEGSNPPDLAAG
jgi:hypothetical protein